MTRKAYVQFGGAFPPGPPCRVRPLTLDVPLPTRGLLAIGQGMWEEMGDAAPAID
jgi:hypothetical protein